MKKAYWSVGLLLLSTALASAQDIKSGKWQMTVKTEMSGIPGMPSQGRAQSHTMEYCITDADKEKSFIKADNCTFSDKKVSGPNVSWKMACSGEPKMSGEIALTINGDNYTGTSTLLMEIEGTPKIPIKGSYTGKYLGNC